MIVAGEVTDIRKILTRRGDPMAFILLEDLQGRIELVVFPKVWKNTSAWIEEGSIVVARGNVDLERDIQRGWWIRSRISSSG